jgi:lipopolysaccharide transport system ATP-binding protein
MSTVIDVENLYKQYRLGQVSTGSIAHDLNRWWHTVRGKEDPYEKITGVNNREENASNDYVWALQEINFSVKQGEVLGIIGRNGAGKSTLLKILSKVTSPTKGNIKVKGRIASLLEVGTGFHPELTGRENIFLNGAILGMTKSEIRSKFDEIVAFSGVEKYIDTPVKRYSSGMYVRLAFAVAAHLEPEILIVDEVLAVGDAEFQKKCLGKMKDVSGEGRTVLFVSHNMDAISALCKSSLILNQGRVLENDETAFILDKYHDLILPKSEDVYFAENLELEVENSSETIRPSKIKLIPSEAPDLNNYFDINVEFKLQIQIASEEEQDLEIVIFVYNKLAQCVYTSKSGKMNAKTGENLYETFIPSFFLKPNRYKIDALVIDKFGKEIFNINEYIYFTIIRNQSESYQFEYPGIVYNRFDYWKRIQ